jgi:competence protein ComGC
MNPLTSLPRPLALLLISSCLGIFAPAMAKENKQTAALQCEQNGELNPCPGDNTADMEKPSQDKSLKAQAEDGTTQTEKKQKRKKKKSSKKSASKKSKANQSVAE